MQGYAGDAAACRTRTFQDASTCRARSGPEADRIVGKPRGPLLLTFVHNPTCAYVSNPIAYANSLPSTCASHNPGHSTK